jgi:hypothetical protein
VCENKGSLIACADDSLSADASVAILFTVISAYCAPLLLLTFARGIDMMQKTMI